MTALRTRTRRLILPPEPRRRIQTWAEGLYPGEACGLLLGREDQRDPNALHVVRTFLARNLFGEESTERYEVDPVDLLAAERAAAANNLQVIGVWHSHADQQAQPSDLDLEHAWEGWSYLIVAVTRAGVAQMRSWRLDTSRRGRRRFQEETVEA
ncbi:MAG: M67 family metallopeptidase [Planctomycetota bacterium]